MKRFYNRLLIPVSALCLSIATFSCMKENADDCPAEVTARFSYTFNEYGTDLFAHEVNDLIIYLFDEHSMFMSSVLIDRAKLKGANSYQMELAEGSYQIIAFGNIDETSYRFDDKPGTRAAAVSLVKDQDGYVNGSLTDLFYGSSEFTVSNNSKLTVDVSMVKNTKNINVLIPSSGGTRTIPDTDYSVRISGSNGAIDFENNTVATPTTYKPNYTKTLYGQSIYDLAQFKTLKLSMNDGTAIELYRDGDLRRWDDLVQLIIQNFPHIQTDDDLLKYSDYEFIYELDDEGNFVLASITAGPWSKQLGQQGGI